VVFDAENGASLSCGPEPSMTRCAFTPGAAGSAAPLSRPR
jgi:hypothetical protein